MKSRNQARKLESEQKKRIKMTPELRSQELIKSKSKSKPPPKPELTLTLTLMLMLGKNPRTETQLA